LALCQALVRLVIEYGSVVWSPYTAVDICRIDRVQNCFMRFADYCLNIHHTPHDYRPVSQAIRLDSLLATCDNFGITFIQRLIEGRVDAPRILGDLSFCIPSNTRLQSTFYTSTNKSKFSNNTPLSKMMQNLNNFF